MMTTLLIVGWLVSLVVAFTAGEMHGHSKSDKWWHQYGWQLNGKQAAICELDGCAMLDDEGNPPTAAS